MTGPRAASTRIGFVLNGLYTYAIIGKLEPMSAGPEDVGRTVGKTVRTIKQAADQGQWMEKVRYSDLVRLHNPMPGY